MSEKDLVLLACRGDKEAFSSLYLQYSSRLYRYALYRLGNENDAKDAVADCIVSAYEQIGQLKNAAAFSSWLFRILYCKCNAFIKEQIERKERKDIDELSNSVSSAAVSPIEKTELNYALDMLKSDEREIVLLSVIAGFKSKEIAKITGLTSGTIVQNSQEVLRK